MSAIGGIFYLNGNPVDQTRLGNLMASMRPLGDRSPQCWIEGNVAIGICAHRNYYEPQLRTFPGTSFGEKFVIAADARIDNRSDLIRLLDLGLHPSDTLSDSDLILHSFLKWGDQCPARLTGDFAFAIWDPRYRRIFCARDHFGVKPLFFFWSDSYFAFASKIRALELLPEVAVTMNLGTVGEFLTGAMTDKSGTMFQQIQRVAAGHTISVSSSECASGTYYSVPYGSSSKICGGGDYVEQFSSIFTTAVQRRMRENESVCCMLSGGLDSSSISCVAEKLSSRPLATISNVYPHLPSCDERPYINDVLGTGSYFPLYRQSKSQFEYDDLIAFSKSVDSPTLGFGMLTNGLVFPTVRSAGYDIVLDGHGGDEVVSDAFTLLRHLAANNQWLSYAKQWIPFARMHGIPVTMPFFRAALSYGTIGKWRSNLKLRSRLKLAKDTPKIQPKLWARHLNPGFIDATYLNEKREAWRQNQAFSTTDPYEAHRRMLAESGQSIAFEGLADASSISGVESRYPFWDKDLVEFCLNLPPDEKLSFGWSRAILRKSMRGILPESIRVRKGKTVFNPQLRLALIGFGESNLVDLLSVQMQLPISPISEHWYRSNVKQLFSGELANIDLWQLGACISLLGWLKHRNQSLT